MEVPLVELALGVVGRATEGEKRPGEMRCPDQLGPTLRAVVERIERPAGVQGLEAVAEPGHLAIPEAGHAAAYVEHLAGQLRQAEVDAAIDRADER